MGRQSTKRRTALVARGRVRRVEFDGDTEVGRTEFRLLYTGFQQGASHQERRPIDQQAHEADLLHKLWAVSTDNAAIPEGVVPRGRLLNAGPSAIEFSDQEWALLLRYYNSDKISWVIDTIQAVVALRTRLESIPLLDPDDS